MSNDKASYRQIMKATSLFGGVQVFNIIITIIRSKFIAVLLGPAGMGIAGLLNSTVGLMKGLTEFGLGTSSVRNIAAANETGNETRIATVVIVMRRLVWITGILGTLATLVLSPWLSQLTFGNHHYTMAFIWLSCTLLFAQLSNGQMVLLQGMRKLNYLAKANVYGSALGLVITIPLYYKLGVDGIVPGIIITSVISLLLSWLFSRKIVLPVVKVTREVTVEEGKGMLTMGFMISLSGLITLGASYVVRIFINHHRGISDVGLYAAGFAIVSTYVGLVFTAMGTDYYPRLSAVAHSNKLCRATINQQAEIALLILTPISLVFLVFIQWVVILLYSLKFVSVNDMIHWAMLGVLFQTGSWFIGFIFLAKGASTLFFWNELISNVYLLGLNILGYNLMGLTGLGISFLIAYIFHFVQMVIVSKIKYSFSFDKPFIRIFSIQLLLAVSCFLSVKLLPTLFAYGIGIVLIIISGWFSWRELDKRMDLRMIMKYLKRK